MGIRLPMTRKQHMQVSMHLESLAEIFGEEVAVTIALHKIGNPMLHFTLTDGPVDEIEVKFTMGVPSS
jgi:hypothetical protein